LPEELVSDNASNVKSTDFKDFMDKTALNVFIPAYHSTSNGQAERSVHIVKRALKTQVLDVKNNQNLPIHHRLARFLLRYHTTPHSIIVKMPRELFPKRQLRTRLTLIKPNRQKHVEEKQERVKIQHDGNYINTRVLQIGDIASVKSHFRGGHGNGCQERCRKSLDL
jgi:hypothetical protein